MTRLPTFSELRWPDDPSNADLALQWASGVAFQVLDWTWRAFDSLRENSLRHVNLTQPLEQLERDLARNHFLEIQILFVTETRGFPTFAPHHEWPETETRASAPAKPPSYDLAFVSMANRRWAWPMEAKVVLPEGSLYRYLQDVERKFIGGVAAPLVGEGGMIAYLLGGDTEVVFERLSRHLDQRLDLVKGFEERAMRASVHQRTTAPDLRLHHMLMKCL